MDQPELNYLFDKVQKLSDEYEDDIKKTGEGFNVFKILGLSYNEVRTHTAFIADLLNPCGSHGRGDVFLELFIEILKNKYSDKWKLNDFYKKGKLIVQKEKTIGPIDKEYTEGGSVDLIMTNDCNSQCIIIENKINAGDQRNQLLRYHKYGERYINGFELFYLTLDGRDASDLSTGGRLNDNNYKKISYRKDILEWLKKCEEEATGHPFIPATIVQYINLIKLLTGETKYKKMEKKIQDKIVENELTFETAKRISEQYNKVVYDLIPGKVRSEVFNAWKERFLISEQEKESGLLLFKYEEYEIYASISEEEEWHTQIWPLKNEKFGDGAANDEKIGFIRIALDPLKKEFKIHPGNGNYSIWLYPHKRFTELNINDRLNMFKETIVSDWVNQLVTETERILNSFVQQILNQPEEICKKILWNEESQKVKEMRGLQAIK